MEKHAPQNGGFFIRFVVFTSTLVCSVVWNQSGFNGGNIIISIWPFNRKRSPDGRIINHKARICTHGGMQKLGVGY